MTPNEARKKYGKEIYDKIIEDDHLRNAPRTVLPTGEIDIPEYEYERARKQVEPQWRDERWM